MKTELKLWAKGFFNLIFPNTCAVCGQQLVGDEKVMCLGCSIKLPRTNFHSFSSNDLHLRLLSPSAPVVKVTSMFYYQRDNEFAALIHDTKYRNRPSIGRMLANQFSEEILQQGFFQGIDAIQPIPMHIIKKMRRGYNQSEEIAKGISQVSGLPIISNLRSNHYHSTQTRRNAKNRQLNALGQFNLKNPSELAGRHILLVDDVITTGSTLLEAIETIKREEPTARISVLTLAATTLQ